MITYLWANAPTLALAVPVVLLWRRVRALHARRPCTPAEACTIAGLTAQTHVAALEERVRQGFRDHSIAIAAAIEDELTDEAETRRRGLEKLRDELIRVEMRLNNRDGGLAEAMGRDTTN